MTITAPPAGTLIGAGVSRVQDDRLLRGDGRYVDDYDDTGVLHAAIVRSTSPHGTITRFDASAALALEGVVLVLGPDDVASVPPVTVLQSQPLHPRDMLLVSRDVKYVGQAVGIVVARSRALAEDGVELVVVDIDELPAVTSLGAAMAPDAPTVHAGTESNLSGVPMHLGTPIEQLEEALAAAATVVDLQLTMPRIAHVPMEPRGLVADWVPTVGELTVVSSTQVPHLVRDELAHTLGLRADQVRVVARDVGGSFGQKTMLFPDELLVCLAARRLGHRVKWIEDRTESLVATYQGRAQSTRARLAVDAEGKFLALHAAIEGDLGAYSVSGTGGPGPFQICAVMVEGPYRFPMAAGTVRAWFTNSVPTGAFRAYGMQEAAFIRERVVDEAARRTGIDPVELRRRNMLRPGDLPYVTNTQMPFDNGDYPAALKRAAELGRERGKPASGRVRRGVGFASMVEITAFAPTFLTQAFDIHWTSWETGKVRINPDGTVSVYSGVTAVGQGIETALAQVTAERLGVPLDWVDVHLGDTATSPYNNMGSQASRGLPTAGGALWTAADRLRERMHHLAVTSLEADDPGDVHLVGDHYVSKTSDAQISWQQVAHRGWMGWGRAQQHQIALEETTEYDPASITFGYATHGAQVSVDLETGVVRVEDYWVVKDAGVVVNPLIVEGQTVGGIAMGVGAALLEEVAYTDGGQPMTSTLIDYLLPLSEDVPDITIESLCTPSTITPGGFKGVGEGGTIPPPAAIANAVAAAVPEIAERVNDIPLSPKRIWTLLDDAGLVE
jgi:carbon-monoxide dehydrogenase large subunit